MRVLYDSKSGYFSAPVPWIRTNGSEQETRVREKIERTGSKRTIKAGLVGRGATDFLAPWMIGGFIATSP